VHGILSETEPGGKMDAEWVARTLAAQQRQVVVGLRRDVRQLRLVRQPPAQPGVDGGLLLQRVRAVHAREAVLFTTALLSILLEESLRLYYSTVDLSRLRVEGLWVARNYM